MEPVTETHQERSLRHHLDVLWRRKWVILLATVVTTGVAVLVGVRTTPTYRATAAVLLQRSEVEQLLATAPQQSQAQNSRVQTEIGVIESTAVREAVEAELGRPPKVSVSARGENEAITDIVEISATSTDPVDAANEANTYADTYVRWKQTNTVSQISAAIDILNGKLAEAQQALLALQGVRAPDDPQVQGLQAQITSLQQQIGQLGVGQQVTNTGGAQVVSEAEPPASPFSPKPVRNGALGLPVGLMLGIGLVFLFDTLDDRIRTKEDLERLSGLPTLGLTPRVSRRRDSKTSLVTLDDPASAAAEAFRSLRTSVKFLGVDQRIRSVLVTSAAASEGKTTTAASLAVALAQSGERVLLIGADLRRPQLHELFGAPMAPGLTTVLVGDSPVGDAIHDVAELPGLHLLPSGPVPPNPSELLGGKHARELLGELAQAYDTVVVDSPPVLPVADAQVLAGLVDTTLVVAAYGETSKRGLLRALELLEQVDATVAGTVLNMVPASRTYAGAPYRYETYRSRSERRQRRQDRRRGHHVTSGGTIQASPAPSSDNGDGRRSPEGAGSPRAD